MWVRKFPKRKLTSKGKGIGLIVKKVGIMKKIVFQGARQCNQNMEGKLTVTFREARITQHEGIWNLKS